MRKTIAAMLAAAILSPARFIQSKKGKNMLVNEIDFDNWEGHLKIGESTGNVLIKNMKHV